MKEIRKTVMDLYKSPFRYVRGYIYDSTGEVVADSGDIGEGKDLIAARVRGWGRIGYMDNAEEIQDEMGVVMAEALTEYMAKLSGGSEASSEAEV